MDSRIEEILKEKVGDPYEEVPLMSRIEILLDRLGSGSGDSPEYAHSLELTINSQTYVLTATLKNTSGETLGMPQTIDLPLETMVIGGGYDDTTKKVILTLKNGNTVDFSVADLVDGLQSEITSSNKLDSDLVDDTNQNHKFVTSAEKTKIADALTEEIYNAGKQVKTESNIGEIFNNYTDNKATGEGSHAEGAGTTASGSQSHAEGAGTTASGSQSHAEGASTTASGEGSHAEGYYTTASGSRSHAEGAGTTASGTWSHAEGAGTIASSARQHVQGKYNVQDSNGKYSFIIGNGTDNNNRSNAFAVDWNGLIYVNNSATGVNVSQLQPIIDSTNKLSADLIDDSNSTNKFVTSAEKTQIATNTHDIAIIKSMLATTFGFRINKNDTNPNTRVEYLYDAVGMNPAYMDFTNDVFSYGDWGNAWFVKDNRPVALKFDGTVDYELDHDDYSKKIDGVTASDITDSSYAGNFMSEIPLVWVKRWEDNDYNYVAFCSQRLDNDYHAYAHTNANGEVNSVCYLPLFKGCIIDGKMRSIAGQTPTGNTTGSTEKTAAEACGSGWQLWDWSKHELIADLLTLISRSTDSQGKFGQGGSNCYSSSASDYGKLPTGGYNSTIGDISTYSFAPTGQFWGSSVTNKHVKVFHIEDFWGNRYDRCLGLNLVDGVYKVKMRPPYALDSDSTYDAISDVTSPNSGYILNVSTGNYGSLPTQIGASQSTGFCDYFGKNSDDRLLLFGGGCDRGAACGSRCLHLYLGSGSSYWLCGGSPCFNPL